MTLSKRLLAAATPLLSLACLLPSLVADVQPPVQPSGAPVAALVQAPLNSTATPTPFLPQTPSAAVATTVTATLPISPTAEGPPWGNYPGPAVNPSVPIPPPVGLLAQPSGQVNLLLLGSDQRPYGGGFRTDTILLLTINPARGVANLTSFPRDLYVYIPGWTMQRINTAQPHGGFPLTALTFEYNFGVRPDHYVMINFWGFSDIVDSLGGINVNVARPLSDHRDRYGTYSVPAGLVHMDGETALWYVRSRYTSSDFDRTRRQQEVILAIFYRLLSLNAVARAPELYNLYRQHVTTDLRLEDLTPLLPLASKLGDGSNINRYYIGREHVTPWRTPAGASVLLPIREAILGVMRQALNVSTASESALEP